MNKFRPRRPRGVVLGKSRWRMLFDRLHKSGDTTKPVSNDKTTTDKPVTN